MGTIASVKWADQLQNSQIEPLAHLTIGFVRFKGGNAFQNQGQKIKLRHKQPNFLTMTSHANFLAAYTVPSFVDHWIFAHTLCLFCEAFQRRFFIRALSESISTHT